MRRAGFVYGVLATVGAYAAVGYAGDALDTANRWGFLAYWTLSAFCAVSVVGWTAYALLGDAMEKHE